MKFRCIYNRDEDNIFTVGNVYEGKFFERINDKVWYDVNSNIERSLLILTEGDCWKFKIVEKEEKEDMEENQACVRGLEALKLMEANGTVFQQLYTSPVLYYKMVNGSLYRSDYPDKDWALNGTFNTNASFIPYVPKSSTGWHDAGKGMDFFWIDGTGVDDERYRFEDEYPDDNRFSTEEKAKEINFKQTLFRKLQRFSDENGGLDIDWNDGEQDKYCIRYQHSYEKLSVDYYWYTQDFGVVYFISEDVANKAIELFHDDLIKYFTM